MQEFLVQLVYLILIILALVVAEKLRVAYPIVLVLGELALSFITRFSNINNDPELVFQGLTLPWVIRKITPEDKYAPISEPKQKLMMKKKIALISLRFLEEK